MNAQTSLDALRERLVKERQERSRSRLESIYLVGPNKHFLSGITYHTFQLATALAEQVSLNVILLRRLVPLRFYPGRSRVGSDISNIRLPRTVRRFEGIDWWLFPSLPMALLFMARRPPKVLVIQWWSAAVWHTELCLALAARLLGAKIVVEFHEVVDTGELRKPVGRIWLSLLAPRLIELADHFVVHSRSDLELVEHQFGIEADDVTVIPVPPFTNYDLSASRSPRSKNWDECNILFFGTIRPYKGLEDLIEAFELLCELDDDENWRLTVVGETWEGWTQPGDLIARSRYRDRITFENRYVKDEVVDAYFSSADVVALPYLRSSTSGPLLVSMAYQLPVVVTDVGGLTEAVEGYTGAVLCRASDADDLARAIQKAAKLRNESHEAVNNWAETAEAHLAMYRDLA